MSATEIIAEIKQLPPAEQGRVITFVKNLEESRELSGEELTRLAERLVGADDPVEVMALKEQIAAGFYGGAAHANR